MNMVKSRLLSRNTISSTIVGVIPKEPGNKDDDMSSLHNIGTAAVVVQVTGTNWPRPSYTLLVTGLCRFKVDELLQESPYPVAKVTQLDKLPSIERDGDFKDDPELSDLAGNFKEQAAQLVTMLDISIPIVAKLKEMLDSLPSHHLPDICASIVKASYSEKIQVLDAVDLMDRFKKTLPLLMRQLEGLRLLQKAGKKTAVSRRLEKPHSMKQILRSLSDGEEDDELDEISDLENKIRSAKMPEHAESASTKELKRLKKMSQQMPEHAMIRNYLELMTELPWSKSTADTVDIITARRDFDADHYGLNELKKRLLEYLAVRQLKNSLKGPILCFVGPPGVGKTSVARSVAHTLGRQFHRISLGGVCDQSDIRGHRRTYIGSMPGRIIHGLKQAGTNNPVFLLDEVDKLGRGVHGDPAAALLEVLDSEQNNSFTDHYLNVAFDLSQVLFIATANTITTIPPALLDRMEVIQVPGYTQEEKIQIAVHHLMKKQLDEHGLTGDQLQLPEDSFKIIVSRYTREAGVRALERTIGAICRAVAMRIAEQASHTKHHKESSEIEGKTGPEASTLAHPPDMPIVIDEHALLDILGPAKFDHEMAIRLSQPGVAIGLAWTALGGEIMYVEATQMDGEGKLILTGQLGDVMKESASLALNWVRSVAGKLGIQNSQRSLLDKTDIHIHFPAGAIGKDGPSAGVTIVTGLVSLFSGRTVRSDTAMTGEITLRGLVLPVGGIKEKLLAAHRAGITRVLLPKRNARDIEELPTNVKKDLHLEYIENLSDVLHHAFEGGFQTLEEMTVTSSKL